MYISWSVLRLRGWDKRDWAINVAYGMSGFSARVSCCSCSCCSSCGGGVGVMENKGLVGSSEDSLSRGSSGTVP